MAQEIKLWNNGITEDQAGSTLPTVNADDNGKTLQVVNGQWDKGGKIPDPQLPAPSSDNAGKIAKVVSDGEGGYIWGADTAPSEICVINATSGNNDVITLEEGVFDKLSDAFTNNKLVLVKVGGTMSFSDSDIIIPVAFSSTSDPSSLISLDGGIVTKNASDLYGAHMLITGGSWSIEGSILSKKIT